MTSSTLAFGADAAALLSLVIWLYLLSGRGGFWRADQRLVDDGADRLDEPEVVCVIPARNEASAIGITVASLLGQDYPGLISIVVVDDQSDDGTGDVARGVGASTARRTLHVVANEPLADGWVGKMWAVNRGLAEVATVAPNARYVLLTDADIEHDPRNLRRLVAKAEDDGYDLVSLMVRLNCAGAWERLLIPAFVFFFQKLYPFPWVNQQDRRIAAAAGGCMLVRRTALDAVGGVNAIRDRLIDDCALARLLKARGRIWLGLTSSTRSLRAYGRLAEIWNMVARTAFVQLEYSWLALIGTIVGMVLLYLVPPAAAIIGFVEGRTVLGVAGGWAWGLMFWAYWPTLRLYGGGVGWALALPVAGVLYTLMTVSSALRHACGRGGGWKGRTYAPPPKSDG